MVLQSSLHTGRGGGTSLGEVTTGTVAVAGGPSPQPFQDREPWKVMAGLASGAYWRKAKGTSPSWKSHLLWSEPCLPQAYTSSGSSSCSAPPHPAMLSCPCQPAASRFLAVWDNDSCSCLPPGSLWLEAWSSLASLLLTTLVFTSEAKGQLFLQVSAPPTGPLGKGSVGQGVRWTAAGALNVKNLGDARQRSHMWQHFNLQQSFLHVAAVTP